MNDKDIAKQMGELQPTEPPKKPELVWESIDSTMGLFYRTKTFGGWLVMSEAEVMEHVYDRWQSGYNWRTALVFVPDPNHEWAK
jgi:hypothetical protein